MRTIVSMVVAFVLFILVGYLAYSGSIFLPEYWTSLAVTFTAIALGILYWGFKPKIDRFFEEKRETQHKPETTPSLNVEKRKAETVPSLKVEKQKNTLLPDNTQITKLNIDDSLLDKIYEQAQRIAIDLYHDALLSRFSIQVFPYFKYGASVNIYLGFYSKWAEKICAFQYVGSSEELKHITPDKDAESDFNKIVFATLPWKTNPQWMQFLDRAYIKIRPLSSAEETCYHLQISPFTGWQLNFEDGFSGKEYTFKWNGEGLDEDSIKQLK